MARTAFVTGGTGFLGINLVHALIADGWEVVAVHREGSRTDALEAAGARPVVAGLLDAEQMAAAMPEGVDAVFHLAGNTSFWRPKRELQWQVNVEGTRNVAAVALERGAKKFVHTSTVSAWGPETGDVITEHTPMKGEDHWIGYYSSKWKAHQVVLEHVDKGLDASLICPGGILGPHDLSNWGAACISIREGAVPGLPPGGMPFCHVREVAASHIAAVDQGRPGESYLLGGVDVLYAKLGEAMATRLGVKAPRRLPRTLLKVVGWGQDAVSRVTGNEPEMTPELVDMLCSEFSLDCSKAEAELGYRSVPLDEMVADMHEWLVQEGHL